MKHALFLAWRYLAHHRVRTSLLVVCLTLVFLLPLAVRALVDATAERMAARAAATPRVAGAPGSRYDLVLNALYFKGRVPAPTSMAELDRLRGSGLATAIPILCRSRARGHPVVGTSHDYYRFRGLAAAAGTFPLRLGQAMLGATVARELGLGPGDTILSDRANLYDLTLAYPLRMRVAGVLAPRGTADDDAVFVDLKTAWIIEGLGHGHDDAAGAKPNEILAEGDGNRVLSPAIVEFNEVTPETIGGYHFHGSPEEFPLTAILVAPNDERAATILGGRYRVSRTGRLLDPSEVVAEILGFVFRLKVFFDANVALVTVATTLFLLLIVLLTLRLRQRERETLFKIGCARATVFRLLATELALVLAAGLALAAVLAAALVSFWAP